MEKRFLVTGNWIDKATAKPVSGIAEISEGISKSGKPYTILNTDSREAPVDGTYPVGTILTATVSFSVHKPQATVKLGSQ